MTIDEDTGERVVCPICDNPEYWECGHLVANFDLTFCECNGGEIYDLMRNFRNLIEGAVLRHLQEGSEPSHWGEGSDELWEYAKENYSDGEDWVEINDAAVQRLIIDRLTEAGAFELPGSLADLGGPGMSSSVALLFGESPKQVVQQAFLGLVADTRADLDDPGSYVEMVSVLNGDPIVFCNDGRSFQRNSDGWSVAIVDRASAEFDAKWLYDPDAPDGWKTYVGGAEAAATLARAVSASGDDKET